MYVCCYVCILCRCVLDRVTLVEIEWNLKAGRLCFVDFIMNAFFNHYAYLFSVILHWLSRVQLFLLYFLCPAHCKIIVNGGKFISADQQRLQLDICHLLV